MSPRPNNVRCGTCVFYRPDVAGPSRVTPEGICHLEPKADITTENHYCGRHSFTWPGTEVPKTIGPEKKPDITSEGKI